MTTAHGSTTLAADRFDAALLNRITAGGFGQGPLRSPNRSAVSWADGTRISSSRRRVPRARGLVADVEVPGFGGVRVDTVLGASTVLFALPVDVGEFVLVADPPVLAVEGWLGTRGDGFDVVRSPLLVSGHAVPESALAGVFHPYSSS